MKMTARRLYIRMLRNRLDGIDSLPLKEREHWQWAELIAAGHLNGVTRTNENGEPNGNIISGPTVKGRLFLQELEEAESKSSFQARLLRFGIPSLTYFVGLLSPLVIAYLKRRLGLEH